MQKQEIFASSNDLECAYMIGTMVIINKWKLELTVLIVNIYDNSDTVTRSKGTKR